MRLYSFDGVVLPDGMSVFDNPAGPVMDGHLTLLSGRVFDGFGEGYVQPQLPLAVTLKAKATATGVQTLAARVESLRGLTGRRGSLIRKEVDGSNEQWAQARLMSVAESHEVKHQLFQPLEFAFALQSGWSSVDETLAEMVLNVGGLEGVENSSSLPIDHLGSTREQPDVTIMVTAGSATISRFGIDYPAANCSWRWNGTLTPGKVLLIDCGAMSITNDSADAYAGMTLTGNHRRDVWLALQPNATRTLYVVWTDNSVGSEPANLGVRFRRAFW